jgi:thiol-disulfide isomerase/thioredoxin
MTTLKYYSTSWCGPCKTIKPIIQDILSKNPSVQATFIDAEQDSASAQSDGIRSVPTVLIYKNGVETNRFIGAHARATYEQAIK